MDNLYVHIKKSAFVSLGVIGIALLIWLATRSPVALGLILGCAVGMLNNYIMYQNIAYIADNTVPSEETPSQNSSTSLGSKKRKPILGLGTRIFFVAGALYAAYTFEFLNMISTLLGVFFTLFVSYMFILIETVSTTHAKGGKM